MTFAPSNVQGPFLQGTDFFSLDPQELQVRLTSSYSKIANSVNGKEIAVYDTNEIVTGQQFYNLTNFQQPRIGFRKVFPFETIAPGTTKFIDHNLTGVTQYTYIGGVCITAFDSRPIPYASVSFITDQIGVRVTTTQIQIFNGTTSSPIISGHITLEYLKN